MRRKNTQITTNILIVSLLLIGVVYAILQANLQINGTAKIQANTWDIHFDNIQVNENSVSIGTGDSPATIDPENNCKVDFEVTLSLPGDFYEFTVDVVNVGTIDGMIGSLNKNLIINNEVVQEIPDYLNYSITYDDGIEIEDNHKVSAGTVETYRVRLEYKTDIEELPQASTIVTSLEPQYVQADSSAVEVYHPTRLYNVFASEYNSESGLVQEYTGEHKDSFTKNGTQMIYNWSASNGTNANTILNKWNVIFGGFCWQMYRTTDTGGVKLIYNGIPNNGICNASGDNQLIGSTIYNNDSSSPAHVGYMINSNPVKKEYEMAAAEGSLFGNDVAYDNNSKNYTLVNTSSDYDSTHHYTCNNTTGVCANVRYYFFGNYYTVLNNGINITQALNNSLYSDNANQDNSIIKTYIDNWYQNNLLGFTSKLEDTIFCNDRSSDNISTTGWNPNGGSKNEYILFHYNKVKTDLSCSNTTDQFSVANSKAPLTYPIGLITAVEINLMNSSILSTATSRTYWTMTPSGFTYVASASIYYILDGRIYSYNPTYSNGVRPVVSLKPGTLFTSGNGSKDNPYIIE